MDPSLEVKYESPLLGLIHLWAERVINLEGQYSNTTKLFAFLYLQIKSPSYTTRSIPYPFERYDLMDILYPLVTLNYSQVSTRIPSIRNKYYELLEHDHFRSIDKLIELVREGLFFEIIINKLKITPPLFTEDLVNRIIEAFNRWNLNKPYTLMRLFRSTFLSQSSESLEQIDFEEFDEIELALLSYLFFERYTIFEDYKDLYYHYKSVETLIKKINRFTSIIDAPSDKTLRMLFKIAIILHLTGYSKSLSLPNEERLKYISSMLTLPPLRHIIKENVKDAMRMGIKITKIPLLDLEFDNPVNLGMPLHLWIILFIALSIPISIASIMHIFLPWKFYAMYYIIGIFIAYKSFKLVDDVINSLWRG